MFQSYDHDIWETLCKSYSMKKDAAVIYELRTKAAAMKQGGMTVTNYYNIFTSIWSEINHYHNMTMTFAEDTTTHPALVERDRLFDFLASLNIEYDYK